MKKHYTPDFSEFHPGFEYESLGITNDNWESYVWDFNYKKEALEVILESKGIRVKYLDREDIEGEGFSIIQDSGQSKETKIYKKETATIYILESGTVVITVIENDMNGCVFKGTIRNKSELKRVMKQVMPQTLNQKL